MLRIGICDEKNVSEQLHDSISKVLFPYTDIIYYYKVTKNKVAVATRDLKA